MTIFGRMRALLIAQILALVVISAIVLGGLRFTGTRTSCCPERLPSRTSTLPGSSIIWSVLIRGLWTLSGSEVTRRWPHCKQSLTSMTPRAECVTP